MFNISNSLKSFGLQRIFLKSFNHSETRIAYNMAAMFFPDQDEMKGISQTSFVLSYKSFALVIQEEKVY